VNSWVLDQVNLGLYKDKTMKQPLQLFNAEESNPRTG